MNLFPSSPALPADKADALERIERSWQALQDVISSLDADQMLAPGPDGWSIKDHLAHVSAWDQSVAAMLKGKPRYPALGVDEATYLAGDDAVNAAIHAITTDQPLDAVLSDLQATHNHMLAALEDLGDDDLRRPYAHLQPGQSTVNSRESLLHRLPFGTYRHYDEHRASIKALAGHR